MVVECKSDQSIAIKSNKKDLVKINSYQTFQFKIFF